MTKAFISLLNITAVENDDITTVELYPLSQCNNQNKQTDSLVGLFFADLIDLVQ